MLQTAYFRNNFLWIVILFFCSCQPGQVSNHLPYYNTADFSPEFFASAADAEQHIRHRISPFSFTDQHGKLFTEKEVQGKIHVANFIFTSCGSICPVMTSHMKLVQEAFGKDTGLVILSYSVTPWIDSVPRLKKYALQNGIISPNWHLLTGDKAAIYQLARQSYFAEEKLGFTKDSTAFLHTEHVLLIDQSGRIRGIYNGTLELETEQMIRDISSLKKEMS